MVRRFLIGLVLSVVAVARLAVADPEEPYIGLAYGEIGLHQFGQQTTQRPGMVLARFGDDLSPLFGVEAHLAMGANSATVSSGGVSESYRLYSLVSAFAKPQIKFHSFSIYGLAGLAQWRTRLNEPGLAHIWSTDHSGAFGAGVQVPFTTSGKWVFDASYVRLHSSASYAIAGVNYRFP